MLIMDCSTTVVINCNNSKAWVMCLLLLVLTIFSCVEAFVAVTNDNYLPRHHPTTTRQDVVGRRRFFFMTTVSSSNSLINNSYQEKKKQQEQQTTTISPPPTTHPLSPSTFAGMVEQRLQEKFGSIPRILDSWRLLHADYEHFEYVGSNNVSPQDSNCWRQAHSYVPRLSSQRPCKTFYDVHDVEWAQKLQESYSVIREEFLRVTSTERLQQEGNNVWAGALTEDASSYGTGWRTLVLQERGNWDQRNCRLFPRTAQAVRDLPAVEVFFASMKPHSKIELHSDNTNFVLTCHLAIDIPESGRNKCRLTVGDDTRQWINGQVMLFDTSILHDAINESDKTRYILMLRVWHPDLTDVEKEALQFTYDCLQIPKLASPNPGERFVAELQLEAMRKFPDLESSEASAAASAAAGFGDRKKSKKNKTKKDDKKQQKTSKGFGGSS